MNVPKWHASAAPPSSASHGAPVPFSSPRPSATGNRSVAATPVRQNAMASAGAAVAAISGGAVAAHSTPPQTSSTSSAGGLACIVPHRLPASRPDRPPRAANARAASAGGIPDRARAPAARGDEERADEEQPREQRHGGGVAAEAVVHDA